MDTNVIIEAHRTGCWNALVGAYRMDTVSRCVEECETGNQRADNPVPVNTQALRQALNPKPVTPLEIYDLLSQCPDAADIDAGEKELLAHALTLKDALFVISSADRAALRVAAKLGFMDRLVSLQELCDAAGVRPKIQNHFSTKWLKDRRTEYQMETL